MHSTHSSAYSSRPSMTTSRSGISSRMSRTDSRDVETGSDSDSNCNVDWSLCSSSRRHEAEVRREVESHIIYKETSIGDKVCAVGGELLSIALIPATTLAGPPARALAEGLKAISTSGGDSTVYDDLVGLGNSVNKDWKTRGGTLLGLGVLGAVIDYITTRFAGYDIVDAIATALKSSVSNSGGTGVSLPWGDLGLQLAAHGAITLPAVVNNLKDTKQFVQKADVGDGFDKWFQQLYARESVKTSVRIAVVDTVATVGIQFVLGGSMFTIPLVILTSRLSQVLEGLGIMGTTVTEQEFAEIMVQGFDVDEATDVPEEVFVAAEYIVSECPSSDFFEKSQAIMDKGQIQVVIEAGEEGSEGEEMVDVDVEE